MLTEIELSFQPLTLLAPFPPIFLRRKELLGPDSLEIKKYASFREVFKKK